MPGQLGELGECRLGPDPELAHDGERRMRHHAHQHASFGEQAVAARTRVANDSLNKEINKNCANLSTLQERYATFCKKLSRRRDERLKN